MMISRVVICLSVYLSKKKHETLTLRKAAYKKFVHKANLKPISGTSGVG
jgi:hypothetical protein